MSASRRLRPARPHRLSPVARRLLLPVAVIALALSACTPASHEHVVTSTLDTTVTNHVTRTRTPPPTFHPKPATTVAPLPPGQGPARGEVERSCPYIASTPDENPDTNVADIEGNHVYRTTVLTATKPVGCRFYFYAPPYEAIVSITTRTFPNAQAAHDAMVLTGQAGTRVIGQPNIVRGVDGVLYRTRFFGPDGRRDWACVFAKGKIMVIVHTHQTDTSADALFLAQAIAPKV